MTSPFLSTELSYRNFNILFDPTLKLNKNSHASSAFYNDIDMPRSSRRQRNPPNRWSPGGDEEQDERARNEPGSNERSRESGPNEMN